MKSNAPWSVKGIERNAREAAKEAARREGMTVGEWLNQMIYSQGQERSSSEGDVDGLKLRDIVTAIEHLRNRIVEAEKRSGDSVSALSRNVGGVVERLQRLERVKPAEGTYEDLARRIEKIEAAGGDRNRIEALKALEKAVAQVAMQFSNAQKTTLHRLDSAEQQLQEFAARIDQVGLSGEPADIGSLKTTIEGLAERVARAEKVAGEAAALRDAAAASVDPDFVEQTGARLRVLGDEIKRGGDQIRAFEGAIAKLSEQIEAAEKRSSEGVQKVADTFAEMQEQMLSERGSGELEAKIAAARRETDERLSALQSSFSEMNERMQKLSEAGVTSRASDTHEDAGAEAQTAAAPETPEAMDAEPTEEPQSVVDDIEEAVAALEAESEAEEEDPFALEGDDLEAEAESDDDGEPLEDFSFELDDEAEPDAEEAAAPQASEAGDAGDARSRLAQVRNALSGEGFSKAADEEPEETDDDIEAILGDLESDDISFGDDDEDEQAPGTASLMPASDIEHEDDDESDEPELADDQPEPEEVAPEASAEETDDDKQAEDYTSSARRRAEEAAANRINLEKRPTRRNLTAKQRAILAARARQKQLTAKASEEHHDDEPAPASLASAGAASEAVDADANDPDNEDTSPSGRFAKITSALSAARSRLSRRKKKDDDAAPAASPHDNDALRIGGASSTASSRNGDRAALETLKATTSARPVTMALAVAIILAIAALAFLVKDFIFPASEQQGQTAPVISEPVGTPSGSTPSETLGDQTASDSDLPSVPQAPAIDPETLYLDAMSALNAAEDETAAIGAISKLQDAAALGFPPAQLQLGELYKTGQGVEQDLGQARVWFRRAANGGNVLAMHRIGVMTARGDGGPADTQAAIAWFEQAANFGLVDSQYNLGAIYHPSENGGAVQDAESAYYWYSLAARNGDEAAEPLAAGVAAGLSDAERAAVDERVSRWSAQEADPVANAVSQG